MDEGLGATVAVPAGVGIRASHRPQIHDVPCSSHDQSHQDQAVQGDIMADLALLVHLSYQTVPRPLLPRSRSTICGSTMRVIATNP